MQNFVPGEFMVQTSSFVPCKSCLGSRGGSDSSKAVPARAEAGSGKGDPVPEWQRSALLHPNNSRAASAESHLNAICLSLADHTERGSSGLICIWLLKSPGFPFSGGVTARMVETKGQMLWAGRVQLASALCRAAGLLRGSLGMCSLLPAQPKSSASLLQGWDSPGPPQRRPPKAQGDNVIF